MLGTEPFSEQRWKRADSGLFMISPVKILNTRYGVKRVSRVTTHAEGWGTEKYLVYASETHRHHHPSCEGFRRFTPIWIINDNYGG
jgi:hypothetical protein